jgi:predicted Zn-ribbon and HTH transcriptional regulator
MSADPHVSFANQLMQAELPTLTSAWACLDCGAIRRLPVNARCPDCGSQSIFDVADALKGYTDAS